VRISLDLLKFLPRGKTATFNHTKVLAEDLLEHSYKNFQIYIPLPKETR